ncbi:MAG: hypothetical protein GZ091_14305 [Paludibacter sp.]|nr:hypothetical protein [Paludibacter sp.]
MKKLESYLLTIALIAICFTLNAQQAKILSIKGMWDYKFDSTNVGISNKWYTKDIQSEGKVELPGTTDSRGIGPLNKETSEYHLNRAYKYRGALWYETTVTIPKSWGGMAITLNLERVQWESQVWIDGEFAGMQESLSVPHRYDLTKLISPGKHRITIRVDNRLKYVIYHSLGDWVFTHAISDETQGNWNGIIGRMELQSKALVSVEYIRVTTTDDNLKAIATVGINNRSEKSSEVTLKANVKSAGSTEITVKIHVDAGISTHQIEIPLKANAQKWDEFNPVMQTMKVGLLNGKEIQYDSTEFGLFTFKSDKRHFIMNDRKLFLRGNLECAIWPLTGHPPMESKDGWDQLMATLKEYGMNHIRFHSYCPPEAAFQAADRAGIIFQVELPLWDGWGNIGNDSLRCRFLKAEAFRILDCYGNHPSFRLFSMGNELGGKDDPWLMNLVRSLQKYDSRRFYSSTTHPMFTTSSDDYFIAANNAKGAIRGSLTKPNERPRFDDNYSVNMTDVDRPTIVHEFGQYSMFFNPKEISKYTGCMKPRNLEMMRDKMIKNGIYDMAGAFLNSSAKFQLSLYKRELEQILSTPELAGCQALGLQDFSGQGTTMCGVLDAFWQPKGVVQAESWRQFCSPTVMLARFAQAVHKQSDTLFAKIQIAHYGRTNLENAVVKWEVLVDLKVIAFGSFPAMNIPTGALTTIGSISQAFKGLTIVPAQLQLHTFIENTTIANNWDLWLYPDDVKPTPPEKVMVFTQWDDKCKEALSNGAKVILFPNENSLANAFPVRWYPVSWNLHLFPGQPSSIGIYLDPTHALFSEFPTNSYCDIQWQQLLDGKVQGINLTGSSIKPIVWAIDDFHSNFQKKLAVVFEAKVGPGRLFVSTLSISPQKQVFPEVRQYLKSVYDYIGSDNFDPIQSLLISQLDSILKIESLIPSSIDAPNDLDKAKLYVHAAALSPKGYSSTEKKYDKIICQQPGFDYSVKYNTGWKDDVESAWVGNTIAVTIEVPNGFKGKMAVFFYDWNMQNRDGQLFFNGQDNSKIGTHGEGRWILLNIDGTQKTYTLRADLLSGVNLMITKLAVLKDK